MQLTTRDIKQLQTEIIIQNYENQNILNHEQLSEYRRRIYRRFRANKAK